MTSEEYVEQVNRLMDLQNTYLGIFLTILGAVIGMLVYFQWRFTSQQVKQIKELTKQETIKEIEESLGVSSLIEFKKNIQNKIEAVEKEHYTFGHTQLDYELTKMYNEKELSLWHINYIMGVYKSHILKSFNDFSHFVLRIDSLILTRSDENIDINSPHIDNI